MIKETNKIKVSGTIHMISSGRNVTSIWVVTDGARGKKAIPQFVFRNGDLHIDAKVGNRVTVEGHLHNRVMHQGQDVSYEQEILGDSIIITPRALKLYFPADEIPDEEGGYPNDENCALIAGRISHIYAPQPDIVVLTVRASDGRYTDNCELTCFRRQAEVAGLFSEGDGIAAVGYVQTTLKRNNNRRVVYQNIVVQDLIKVSL